MPSHEAKYADLSCQDLLFRGFAMKLIACMKCGASDFSDQDGYKVCRYCHSKHIEEAEDIPRKNSTIELNDDIARLLSMCKAATQ